MKEWQNPTMRRGIAWIAGSTVLAVASVGGWVAYSRRLNSAADTVEVRVLTVERKDVERTVTESGTVRLANQQTLKSPSDATVVEVNVSVGDRVSSGRELVVLRDDKELTQLEEHLLKPKSTLTRNSSKSSTPNGISPTLVRNAIVSFVSMEVPIDLASSNDNSKSNKLPSNWKTSVKTQSTLAKP